MKMFNLKKYSPAALTCALLLVGIVNFTEAATVADVKMEKLTDGNYPVDAKHVPAKYYLVDANGNPVSNAYIYDTHNYLTKMEWSKTNGLLKIYDNDGAYVSVQVPDTHNAISSMSYKNGLLTIKDTDQNSNSVQIGQKLTIVVNSSSGLANGVANWTGDQDLDDEKSDGFNRQAYVGENLDFIWNRKQVYGEGAHVISTGEFNRGITYGNGVTHGVANTYTIGLGKPGSAGYEYVTLSDADTQYKMASALSAQGIQMQMATSNILGDGGTAASNMNQVVGQLFIAAGDNISITQGDPVSGKYPKYIINATAEDSHNKIDSLTLDADDHKTVHVVDTDGNKNDLDLSGLQTDQGNQNAADIKSLNTRMGAVEGDISDVVGDITDLSDRMDTAENDIVTNKADIATNKQNIATNAANIETNRINIATNTADIAQEIDDRKAGDKELEQKLSLEAGERKAADQAIMDELAANWDDHQNIQKEFNEVDYRIDKLNDKLNTAGASLSALAGLHYQPMRPQESQIAVGTGHYRGKTAVALGSAYQFNNRIMGSLGGSYCDKESMINLGFSYKFGAHTPKTAAKQALQPGMSLEQAEMKAQLQSVLNDNNLLKAENEEMKARLAKLESIIQKMPK